MSDSTQRRGTDYESLRGMGAASSRAPREAEDPLAELARLVSQSDTPRSSEAPRPSYGTAGEPRSTYTAPAAPQPLRTGYKPYAPPAVDRTQDRLDPIGRDMEQQAHDPRAYGAAAEPDYDPNDFFAEPAPLPPVAGGYGNYRDDDFGTDFQPRAPFHDEFDDTDNGIYPGADEDVGEDMPVRSRGKLVMAAVAGLVLVGSIGAWAFGGFGGETADGAPPVIKAENGTPIKVVPEAKPVARAKESYDRIDPNATATVVPSAEEPGEKPTPRVILPGASSSTTTEARVAEASPQLAPSEPGTDTNMGRRVRTIAIRPDGSMAAPASEPQPSAQALVDPNPAPPAPIQGVGSAEGMSMQPGREFGIMSSEPPPQDSSAQHDVPVPQRRPSLPQQDNYPVSAPQAPAASAPVAPQARAATEVPAPRSTAGGPPSTPQPQVTITNKRPLKPTGAPAPGAQNRPAAAPLAPARPVATVPVAPAPSQTRQVAMAGSTPPAAARPAPAGPQVAAVTGSSGAFGVQLTAQRSEAEAMAAFNALKQRYPQVLGAYSAMVARADLGAERGVFYRAMVPAQSQTDASNLCIQFKASGVDCIVQRR